MGQMEPLGHDEPDCRVCGRSRFMEEEVKLLQKEVVRLEEQAALIGNGTVEDVRREWKRWRDRAALLEDQLTSIKEVHAARETALRDVVKQHELSEAEAHTRIGELTAERADMRSKMHGFRSAFARLRMECGTLRRDLQEARAEVVNFGAIELGAVAGHAGEVAAYWQARVAALEHARGSRDLDELLADRDRLRGQLQGETERAAAAQRAADGLRIELQKSDSLRAAVERRAAEARAEGDARAAELERRTRALEAELAAARGAENAEAAEAARREAARLRGALEEAEAAAARARAESGEDKERLARLQREAAGLTEQHGRLQKELRAAQEQLQQLRLAKGSKETAERLAAAEAALEAERGRWREERERARERLQEAEAELQSRASKIAALNAEIAQRNRSHNAQLTDLQESFMKKLADVDSLHRSEIGEAEAKLREQLRKERDEARERLQLATTGNLQEAERHRLAHARLQAELADERAARAGVEGELAAARSELAGLRPLPREVEELRAALEAERARQPAADAAAVSALEVHLGRLTELVRRRDAEIEALQQTVHNECQERAELVRVIQDLRRQLLLERASGPAAAAAAAALAGPPPTASDGGRPGSRQGSGGCTPSPGSSPDADAEAAYRELRASVAGGVKLPPVRHPPPRTGSRRS